MACTIPRKHQVRRAVVTANSRDQEMTFRMQAKTTAGRERAVEHIIGEVREPECDFC